MRASLPQPIRIFGLLFLISESDLMYRLKQQSGKRIDVFLNSHWGANRRSNIREMANERMNFCDLRRAKTPGMEREEKCSTLDVFFGESVALYNGRAQNMFSSDRSIVRLVEIYRCTII